MESVAQYLLQVVAVAILCGVIGSLCDKSIFATVIRLILGTVMLLTVIKPVMDLKSLNLKLDLAAISAQGEEIAAHSVEAAKTVVSDRISERVNAYVEEKGACWGADIKVLTDIKDGIPDRITIIGEVSPYARSQLISWIESEIGIKREAMEWK